MDKFPSEVLLEIARNLSSEDKMSLAATNKPIRGHLKPFIWETLQGSMTLCVQDQRTPVFFANFRDGFTKERELVRQLHLNVLKCSSDPCKLNANGHIGTFCDNLGHLVTLVEPFRHLRSLRLMEIVVLGAQWPPFLKFLYGLTKKCLNLQYVRLGFSSNSLPPPAQDPTMDRLSIKDTSKPAACLKSLSLNFDLNCTGMSVAFIDPTAQLAHAFRDSMANLESLHLETKFPREVLTELPGKPGFAWHAPNLKDLWMLYWIQPIQFNHISIETLRCVESFHFDWYNARDEDNLENIALCLMNLRSLKHLFIHSYGPRLRRGQQKKFLEWKLRAQKLGMFLQSLSRISICSSSKYPDTGTMIDFNLPIHEWINVDENLAEPLPQRCGFREYREFLEGRSRRASNGHMDVDGEEVFDEDPYYG